MLSHRKLLCKFYFGTFFILWNCLNGVCTFRKGVRLGEYNLATDTDCTGEGDKRECIDPVKDVGVEKKIVHSDYNSTTGDNDIAIVILDQKVDFSGELTRISIKIF